MLVVIMMLAMSTAALADEPTSGTITIENATKGITYQAYKLFDATYSGTAVSYKIPAAKKDSLSTKFFNISTVADSEGNYSFSVKTGVSDDQILTWVKSNYSTFAGDAISGAWSNNSTYVFSNLEFGYYYITSSLGTVVTIDSAVPVATVKDKNDSSPDTPDKKIVGEDTEAFNTGVESNDAGVGSTEDFEVKFDAVNWITSTDSEAGTVSTTQAKAWKFTDTPTGLSINADSVKVYVTSNGTEQEITNTITNKTVDTTTGVLSFTIPWIDNNGKSLYQPKVAGNGETQTAKIPVRVTYTATITAAAATAVAPNTIEVKYTNPSDTDFSIGTDETKTYTYKFQLDKTTSDYTALLGAKFELYKGSVDEANKVKFSVSENTYTVDPNGSVTEIDLTTVASATILGLDKAAYVLRETVVPNGYNQAEDQTVSADSLVRVDGTIADEYGIENDNGVVTVVNNQGAELPSTGGIGTTIFYVIGAILVIGAGIILVTRKRMSNAK